MPSTTGTGICPLQFAGKPGQGGAGKDHDVGPVLGDGLPAEGQQRFLEVLLHGADGVEAFR